MKWHGVSGRTVSRTLELDLNVIESFRLDIVIMQLGSKDLTDSDPLHVGSAIEDFEKGFWRQSQNVYARDGVHLNSLGQEKYYRTLRDAILGSLSLFTIISSC